MILKVIGWTQMRGLTRNNETLSSIHRVSPLWKSDLAFGPLHAHL